MPSPQIIARTSRLGAAYFLLQGAGVIAWWLALMVAPAFRRFFLPDETLDPAFAALAAPDILVLALGSIVAAVLAFRRRATARTIAWISAGAAAYAALYTVAWTVLVGAPALSAALMLTAMGLSVWCARQVV